MIKLRRAQYRYDGEDRMDVTAKSAKGYAKWFAPSWQMIFGHKSGTINDETYTKRYMELLDRIPDYVFEELEKWDKITFVCFCPDGKFCHTNILIDYLVNKFPDKFEKD